MISRTSVIQYKDAPAKRLPEIARELNVDGIVEGAIVRSGSRVRITAQLIDARSDRHVWARSYEREPSDLAGLQKEVAHAIGEAVVGKPTSSSDRQTAFRRIDPDAYRLFFQSLVAASRQTYEGFRDAIAYCQQAIEKDPTFAAAYGRMGLYYQQFSFFGTIAPKEFMPQAEAAARRAIELDDTLAEAHAVLGAVLYRFRWDWTAGEREFRRALTLNPSYAEGHRMFSVLLAATGRPEEAVAEARRGRDLDPRPLQAALNLAQAYVSPAAIARIYVGLGDGRVAHAWLEKAYLEHDIALVSTAADVGLATLRSDAEFHDLFSRVGLVR